MEKTGGVVEGVEAGIVGHADHRPALAILAEDSVDVGEMHWPIATGTAGSAVIVFPAGEVIGNGQQYGRRHPKLASGRIKGLLEGVAPGGRLGGRTGGPGDDQDGDGQSGNRQQWAETMM